jgi:lysophospholipase L1-like esterase
VRIFLAALTAFTAIIVAPASASAAVLEYVALGDSFSSGLGAPPYSSEGGSCNRSVKGYPRLWSAEHSAYTLVNVACAGATIDDVRKKQLPALSRATRLVTLTIGGTDDGYRPTLEACVTGTAAECHAATRAGIHKAGGPLRERLTGLYRDIAERAPEAKIVVLGYPRLVREGGLLCGLIGPKAAQRADLNANADALAEGIEAAADRAHVIYVDVRKTFAGHDACARDNWIRGVEVHFHSGRLQAREQSFHPTAEGQAAYARALSHAL